MRTRVVLNLNTYLNTQLSTQVAPFQPAATNHANHTTLSRLEYEHTTLSRLFARARDGRAQVVDPQRVVEQQRNVRSTQRAAA